MSPISTSLSTLFLLLSLTFTPTLAQTVTPDGCLRLSGSNACPGFSTAYVHPSNLSNAFPFFSDVTDVPSFDAGVFRYLSDPNQYRQTKFVEQLGCSNSTGTTLRYARTVLCSSWVNSRWSVNCFDLYNRSDIATGPKMICRDSCIAMSEDEQRIVDNPEFCPGPDLTGGLRNANITKDLVQCTNWTTLATDNPETCVRGDTNEGNCGYGSSTNQLCSFCNASSPDSCCYGDNTDLASCGYTLAALPSPTQSGGSNEGSSSTGEGLSGGQIAGIVVGSVLGGLLALSLLLWLLMFCGVLPICGYGRRRHRDKRAGSQFGNNVQDSHYQRSSTANNAALLSATPDSGEGSVDGPQMTQLGRGGMGAMSSRTMFGGTSVLSAEKPNGYAVAPVGLGKPISTAGSETTAQKQRALLSSVRDENQSGEHLILPSSTVTVLWPYSAALPDELSLSPGMKLVVLRIYDDAWGTGQVVSGNEGDIGRQGAFPLVCVTENNTASEGSYSSSVDGGTDGITRSTSGQALSESQSTRERRY